MMLVIPADKLDGCINVLREVQECCIDVKDYTNAQRIEMVITVLNIESVDVMQSIVRGRKQIILEE